MAKFKIMINRIKRERFGGIYEAESKQDAIDHAVADAKEYDPFADEYALEQAEKLEEGGTRT